VDGNDVERYVINVFAASLYDKPSWTGLFWSSNLIEYRNTFDVETQFVVDVDAFGAREEPDKPRGVWGDSDNSCHEHHIIATMLPSM